MSANINVRIYYSLEKAEAAGYKAVGEPARYLGDTSKFDLENSREELLQLADFSFPGIEYEFLLLLKDCGPKNKCTGDGFWIQPAKLIDNETLYQLVRGYDIIPCDTQKHPY
jgi:hypothetical protein